MTKRFVICILFVIFALLILSLFVRKSNAQSCGSSCATPGYSQPVIIHQAGAAYAPTKVVKVVKKVADVVELVYPQYVALAPIIRYPSYGAQYVPIDPALQGQYQQQGAAQNQYVTRKELSEVMAGIAELKKEIQSLKTPRVGEKKSPADDQPDDQVETEVLPDVRAVATAKCALCHQRGNEGKGGDLVLTEKNGAFVKLTAAQLLDFTLVVQKQTMPKLNSAAKKAGITALNRVESIALLQEIARQRSLLKNPKP